MISNQALASSIATISDQILDYLLDYRRQNPEFTFALRSQDSATSKEERLKAGYWFQGSDYIYVPLFKVGDQDRRIKTIGFEISFNRDGSIKDNFIEISFKRGNFTDREIKFHQSLARKIELTLNRNNHGIKMYDNPKAYINNLKDFLSRFRPLALAELKRLKIEDKYIISPEEFERNLSRIMEIKQQAQGMKFIETEIEYPKSFPNHGQFQVNFSKRLKIPKTVEQVTLKYNGHIYSNLTLGTEGAGLGRIYIPNNGQSFIKNNPHLKGGEKIKVEIGWLSQNSSAIVQPLNQILYGPPGTGKTYATINKALGILGETTIGKPREELTALFRSYVEKGRIVFTTFHQSMSYEDFVEGIKPETSSDGKVTYGVVDGIFKKLCMDALFAIYNKDRDYSRKSSTNDLLERKDVYTQYSPDWYDGTLDNNIQQTPHVLIIDEVNRGNVSSIFGELITLIEEDKRTGKGEWIEVTLPYSKEKFSVPPNIFIIGTMNTADRSVEALDTALRRRFCFEEILPDADVLYQHFVKVYCDSYIVMYKVDWEEEPWLSWENQFLTLFSNRDKYEKIPAHEIDDLYSKDQSVFHKKMTSLFEQKNLSFYPVLIMEKINQRLERLLDKDHQIGHSYFMKIKEFNDLKAVFSDNILPLLQEYFFGDYSKIGLVLGEGFFEQEQEKLANVFAKFRELDGEEFAERPIYKLKNVANMDTEDFHSAIDKLLA